MKGKRERQRGNEGRERVNRRVVNLHSSNMQTWRMEGGEWVMENGRQEEKERGGGGAEWGADLPQSLNALLMTAKGESALEIGEEELPALYRSHLPNEQRLASAYK